MSNRHEMDDFQGGWEPTWKFVVVSEGDKPVKVTVGWVANRADSFPIAVVGVHINKTAIPLREFNRFAPKSAQAIVEDAIRRARYRRKKKEEEAQEAEMRAR